MIVTPEVKTPNINVLPGQPISITVGQPGPPGRSGDRLTSINLSGSGQLDVNKAYVASGDSLQLLNLPTTAQVDDVIVVCGTGTGLFRVTQNDNQTILFNAATTTIGVSGRIESTHINAVIKLLCVGVDTWAVDYANGNFEVA